ncbi:MAG: hypothetical protein JJ879_08595 [Sneathiella sp.]|nr:hypothetical protein [Sneathiella sp.]
MKKGFLSFVILMFFALLPTRGTAETFKLGILHGNLDIFEYEISVVRLALEQAEGDHELIVIPLPNVTQERILKLLEYGHQVNVFFTGYSLERENTFLQVDVPLTRGLLGHRVFVRKAQSPPLSNIQTINQLRQYIIGSGLGWPDTDIFEAAGFEVAKATYANLWPMLDKGRYDLFNRGINEASTEIKQQREKGYQFTVDENVLVAYPFDYFLYLNKKSTRLHQILTEGLQKAHANGTFKKNFFSHPVIRTALKQFPINQMQLFQLDNPYVSDRIRNIPYSYWYHIGSPDDDIPSE